MGRGGEGRVHRREYFAYRSAGRPFQEKIIPS